MRTINTLWIGALAAASLAGADRPGVIMSGSGTQNGIIMRFTAVAEPPLKDSQGMPGGIKVHKDRIQRYMIDSVTHQYFGYDLVLEHDSAPGRLRVSIQQLTLRASDLSPVLLPKYPAPMVVDDGDTIALDLLVSADGKQKIVDYIEVGNEVEPPAADVSAPARDFTLDDGPLAFEFRLPTRLLINGNPYPGSVGMTGKPGGTLWFAIAGRGRYILSLAPHEGFTKGGAIRDNTIVFESDGERYELRTSGPIVGSRGAWNLYVLHDAQFQARDYPQYGTDRLQNLLPRR